MKKNQIKKLNRAKKNVKKIKFIFVFELLLVFKIIYQQIFLFIIFLYKKVIFF